MPQAIFFLLLMGALLLISAFFSGTETALFSLSSEAIRRLRKKPHFEAVLSILRRTPADLLSSILFGNLIVNILFFCSGAVAAGQWGAAHGELFEVLGGILILIVVIVFGEIVPKAVGINHSVQVLKIAAAPLEFWFRLTRRLLYPLRFLGGKPSPDNALTLDELKELLDSVRHEPGFGTHEKEILGEIVELSDVRVRELMVPRLNVFRKPVDSPRQEILDAARQGEHRHILIYSEKEENLLGYIQVKDLFFADHVEPLIHPLLFIPETKRADILLQEFMKGGCEVAAVVDEYGGFAGTVTLEDIFSEVVGDLEPEVEDEIIQLDDTTYRLRGQLSIREWRELVPRFIQGKEIQALAFDTLGGFIISLLGRMPQPGDEVTLRNLRLTVETMARHRVETVLLHLDQPEGPR